MAALLIVLLLTWYPENRQLKNNIQTLQGRYDSLYAAKTKTDTVITIDTLRIKETQPGKQVTDSVFVTDTLYLNQPLQDRTYVNTLYKGDVRVDYLALTRGWLMDLEVDVVVPIKEIHTQSIVPEYVQYSKPGIVLGAGVAIPKGWYVNAGYYKKPFIYRATYVKQQKNNLILVGIDIKL